MMLKFVILAMLVATCQAADIVLGKYSDITWTAVGANRVAVWDARWPNLVSRWKFDGNALDYAGTNDGVWQGTATYASGHDGQAVSLDGASYVTVCQDGRSCFATQSWTVCAWVWAGSNPNFLPVWSYDYTAHSSPYYAQNLTVYPDGRIVLSWNNTSSPNGIETSAGAFGLSGWHHLAATFKRGEQCIYLDGAQVAVGSATDTIAYFEQPVWIGHANFATAPACLIDDVMFFDAALSSNNVLRVMNGLNPM